MPDIDTKLVIEGDSSGADAALQKTTGAMSKLNKEVTVSGGLFQASFNARVIGHQIQMMGRDVGDLTQKISGCSRETSDFVSAQVQAAGAIASGNPFSALAIESGQLLKNISALAVAYSELKAAEKNVGVTNNGDGSFSVASPTAKMTNQMAKGEEAVRWLQAKVLAAEAESQEAKQAEIILQLEKDKVQYAKDLSGMKEAVAAEEKANAEKAREDQRRAEEYDRDSVAGEEKMRKVIREGLEQEKRDKEKDFKTDLKRTADRANAVLKSKKEGYQEDKRLLEQSIREANAAITRAQDSLATFTTGAADKRTRAVMGPAAGRRADEAAAKAAKAAVKEDRDLEKNWRGGLERMEHGAPLSGPQVKALEWKAADQLKQNQAEDLRKKQAAAKEMADLQMKTITAAVERIDTCLAALSGVAKTAGTK